MIGGIYDVLYLVIAGNLISISKEEITKSGIVLPDTVDKEKPEKREVIAIEPGKELENKQLSKSDIITIIED